MTIARWPNVVLGPLGERMAKFLENYPKADEIYITSGRDGDHGDVYITTVFRTAGRRRPRSTSVRAASVSAMSRCAISPSGSTTITPTSPSS